MISQENNQIMPIKKRGIIIHSVFIIFGISMIYYFIFQLINNSIGPKFVVLLLLLVIVILLLLFLTYRLISLIQAEYLVSREGIFLKWGYREQLISMNDVLWIRLSEDVSTPIQFPIISWMGVSQGFSVHEELGKLEFMFSDLENIVLVGTKEIVYVISPENRNMFLLQFQRALEFGTLVNAKSIAIFPNFLLIEIWKLPAARYFLLPAIIFSISLLILTGFAIPNVSQVSLGYSTAGFPLNSVPSVQLVILPIINIILLIFTIWISTYIYQRWEKHPVISLIFASSSITSFIFLMATIIILTLSN